MRRSLLLFLRSGMLSQYEQEAYEASRRFKEADSYPGPIRASTPGDTRFYVGSVESILNENERHYWRAVTDDPLVQRQIPLRIKFKTQVWVTSGWEQRLQVVQVTVPHDCTVQELIEQVKIENQSPYLCLSKISLAENGKELDPTKSIAHYGLTENSSIDAIEEFDHISHQEAQRPKDWNVDEITADHLARSPYKEMGMEPSQTLAPRYEARPKGYFGKNNYSGMKQ